MNKAVTEGLDLMPPDFIDGLDIWSDQDGTPGSTSYDTNPNGTLVASDPDFGPCLELLKAENPQKLRHMGETPILPGCYLEVTARVKWMSGTMPQVRIAAWAGDANGDPVNSVTTVGESVTLTDYGRVFTVRAIIGSGARTGVDMVWGTRPVYGHIGLDLLGANGTVIRVESIRVEDKTSIFHRKMMDWVDVRDYGAVGDGITDDSGAFETADAAAGGREVLVPEGIYYLDKNVTMLSPVRFDGTVTMPQNRRLILRSNFDYPSYVEAFGDETLALKKALQALFSFSDHDALDLGGRLIQLTEPIDVAAAASNATNFTQRRVIRNGQLSAEDTPAWDSDVVTGNASYSEADPLRLTNVENIAQIQVGALVEGFGVGREVYVRAKDEGAGEITLSQPLSRARASQGYTFTRFKYMLDFSGFNRLSSLNLDGLEFDGNRRASGVLMSQDGIWWTVRNCWFREPADRAITSHGAACQGITIDQCEFIAPDADLPTQNRSSVCFNVNQNDAKIRHNRSINFRHFGILAGSGNLVLGNHFWQLDDAEFGQRTAGLILTRANSKTTITGNYIDSQWIEVSNEHQVEPAPGTGESFGSLTIVGNIFTAQAVPDWFRYIVLAPVGAGRRIKGLSVIGNTFKNFGGIDTERVDGVDTSHGDIDFATVEEVVFDGNTYERVNHHTRSPALVEATRNSAQNTWTVAADDLLPFGGFALGVDGVTAHGQIRTAGGGTYTGMPWVETRVGADQNRVNVRWAQAVTGTVQLRVRVDRAF